MLDILFPRECVFCKKESYYYICDECYNSYLSKYEIKNFSEKNTYSIFRYEDEIRKLLIDYKFNDKCYLEYLFEKSILKNNYLCNLIKKYDIIIPVPTHKKRKSKRGYNQTEEISNLISKDLKIQNGKDILVKIKNLKPQSLKSAIDRKNDIIGAFKVNNKEKIFNKNIILFDDIYTTGSTTKECKKVLLENDAKNVFILTIAREFFNDNKKVR